MRRHDILTVVVAVGSLAVMAAPAVAATAHNSQAGSLGPSKDICGPTAYFRDGGCLASFFLGADDEEALPSEGRYRARPPLRPLDR